MTLKEAIEQFEEKNRPYPFFSSAQGYEAFKRIARYFYTLGAKVAREEQYEHDMAYINSLPQIDAWLARDEEGELLVGQDKPKRNKAGFWTSFGEWMKLPEEMYPELTWESEPKEIEIIFKEK